MCVKKGDGKLLHIIKAKDLDKPFYEGFVCFVRADFEEEAFDMTAKMVREFCEVFWAKGIEPDFGKFQAWALGEKL